MIRLLLIRHAKSSWDTPGLADHERRLNDRGRRDAPRIGRWLLNHGLVPDHALVSSARRTQETWALLTPALGPVPTTTVPELYETGAEGILAALRKAPPAATLALIGHNPGIGEAARRLLARPPSEPAFARYPTSATSVIDFDADDWSAVAWSGGSLALFVTPRTLPDP